MSYPLPKTASTPHEWNNIIITNRITISPIVRDHRTQVLYSATTRQTGLPHVTNFQLEIHNFHLKSVCYHEFQTLPHPATFLTAYVRSKENLSVPVVTQKYLLYISCSFISLISIRNKKMKSWFHPAPLPPLPHP